MPDWPSDLDQATASSHELARLLDKGSSRRPDAFEELFPLVYGELRKLATVERDRQAARQWLHRRLPS